MPPRRKKPARRSIPRTQTQSGLPGNIIRPPYTKDNHRAPGQCPESIRLDTTVFDASIERKKSPNPARKFARKGTRRMVLQNDMELERWLDFRLHLVKSERAACEEARKSGQESFRVIQRPQGDIVEVFFKIDINTYSPQAKLAEIQNLSCSDFEATSAQYHPIHVPSGALYLALDCNLERLFVLFSDPYSLLYGPEVGKKVQNQARENITNYALVDPPEIPENQRHREYEQWLLENPEHCFRPESRCGAFHWGVWMERGHRRSGPLITPDTNELDAQLRAHQHDLFNSLRNLSYLKRFLLGAVDKAQRDEMQEVIRSLPDSCKQLWCKSETECFTLRACLVNLLTQSHIDSGDVKWAIISPFGSFEDGEFCIADLERRFTFQEGHIAAIRGKSLVHFTRKWSGSRISLVSTMHRDVLRHCLERMGLGECVSTEGNDGSEKGEPVQKRAKLGSP